jgi:hypothetical protein
VTVATLAARNANDVMVTPIVRFGGVCVWRESRIWTQTIGFVLVRFARNVT